MEWSEVHDLILAKEVRLSEPWNYKARTVDRGKVWTEIADRLNKEGPEGVKWELGFSSFWAGKMGFVHWDWDFTTGNGTNTLENGNGISVLCETC